MANPKTKQARDRLLHFLKGQEPVPLELAYSCCDSDYEALAGALSSLIEKEEVLFGRTKTRHGWLIGASGTNPPDGVIVWHTDRNQMRGVLPKVLKELKKRARNGDVGLPDSAQEEKLKIITGLLSDGKPRTMTEIVAATGLQDLSYSVWRSLSKLPDGRFTLPDSEGAWESLFDYIRERPRRLADLLRLYRSHKEITAKLAAANNQELFVRLPRGMITTPDSTAGRKELAKNQQIKLWRDTLESLPYPFFIPEQLALDLGEFPSLADCYALTAEFEDKKYYCLRRDFPGEVLVDQLGEISGRYFAPPHTASAPVFLKEHSLGERESARVLGLNEETVKDLVSSGELDHFTLDERIRLWRSDLEELKRDRDKLRRLVGEYEKLGVNDTASLLGITSSQVRRLVEEGSLAPADNNQAAEDTVTDLIFKRSDVEKMRAQLPAALSRWAAPEEQARRHKELPADGEPRTKKRPLRKKETSPPEQKLVLDDFQIEASDALREGLSVLVSAPTGNGKTLVAEMLAKDVMAQGLGMVYTSPLKALSNQKYRDFRELFGEESVGLVTGDISINPGAPMLIMTTEIFRNWCLSEPDQLARTSYVVFDEIHYLDDAERGTTWEESILFAPPHMKILGLSATVPNVDEMADWISSVRGGNVVVILEKRRSVPLAVRWLLPSGRIVPEKEARGEILDLAEAFKRGKRYWVEYDKNVELPEVSCSEIIGLIQDKLPALFFVFSRGRTEILAQELGRDWDFLNAREKSAVSSQIKEAEALHPGTFSGPGWRGLRRLLLQGIAYHHAGLLPPIKYLVEKLYSSRQLWVVFCTETFAAGVNFPAASAIFDSTRKWDGYDFRILQNREFFQIAGRAGRRGFDQVGHVFIRVDSRFPEQTGFFEEKEVEPVSGRLAISPNTVLSLLRYKTDDEIECFLNNNFKMHQLKKKRNNLEQEIKIVSDRVLEIEATLCPENLTLACPLERIKARRQLKRLRWKGRKKEKDNLQKQLSSFTPKRCRETESCRLAADSLRQARNYLRLLRQEFRVVSEQADSVFREFREVRDLLEKLGYVKGREFYPRGIFALELHVQEILVTELAFAGLIEDAEPAEVAAFLAGVEFVPGRNTFTAKLELPASHETQVIKRELLSMGVPEKFCVWSGIPGPLAYAWYNGATFAELLEMSSLQPGDIFSIFRREIDLLRQIERAAAGNTNLAEKVRAIRNRLDREEIALSF
ncbi:DEAD/DEAH box helicase [Pelotomaculum propionicicum]|uniref:Putative helicase HelY n=1 Tax=Pelotomaculum propionicicum TaxID=258475 RepID=A0A4Y7RTS2_9FIRM|nr:putative helicase HelY [Pelotomaculum propionicicum]